MKQLLILLLASVIVARGQVLYFDNFEQFSNGTGVPDGYSYSPASGPPGATNTIYKLATTTVTMTNLAGSMRVEFNCPPSTVSTHWNEYQVYFSPQNNPMLMVTWQLRIEAVKPGTLGLAAVLLPIVGNDDSTVIAFNDGGEIFAVTNVFTAVSDLKTIGSWSNLAATVMTNQLLLDYPARTMTLSVNGVVVASRPLRPDLASSVDRVVFEFDEHPAYGSTGNKFALDNVKVESINPTTHNAPESIAGYTVALAITNINGTPIPAAFATNVYGVSTFSQIGPNADNTYSGTYTYTKTGADTGTIIIYKTAPPDQAGETTTNHLVFNSPLTGTFAHYYDFVDTPPAVQYGTFQVVQTNGLTGSLQVTISPAGAISAGAQWQVDGGAWQNSGNTVSGLTVGNHTVACKTIVNWNTPSSQTVAIIANTTTVTNGTYVAQAGSLQVTITPAAAVTAGAQWQVDGGAWQNSGAMVGGLSVGNHTVAYKIVSGWNSPANQTVVVIANTTVSTNGVYATLDYTFATNNGAITITGYVGPGGAISIPASINGLPVVSIGDSAFQSKNVTSVIIPNTVTNIGALAFYYCNSLTNVSIPNGVIAIGYVTFYGCGGLPNVHIPSSVLSIGDRAFSGPSGLTSITVDGANPNFSAVSGVLFNKNQTVLFQYPAKKFGPYVIPATTTNIGAGAFYACNGLTNINIPASVNTIGFVAFAVNNLTNISVDAANPAFASVAGVLFNKSQSTLLQYPTGRIGSYSIPNTVTLIGIWSFTYTYGLTAISIPNSVLTISNQAFSSCIGLTNVTIPDSVRTIGRQAFGYCNGLVTVTIGNSVTNIDDIAFDSCANLKNIFFKGNAPTLGGASVFANDNNATVYYLLGTTGWGATYGGRPAVLWNPAMPTSSSSFGVKTNRFGFTISGTANIPIVVEANTNVVGGSWIPLLNATLTNGSIYFSDSQWTNYPKRYYRIRSP